MNLPSRAALSVALCLACSTSYAADAGLDKKSLDNARGFVAAASKDTGTYAILESLTTEIGPRLAGSPAFDHAVEWAQAKFKALGYDRIYLEPVSFPIWERRHETAAVISPFPQRLIVTALGGSVGTADKPLEAEVVEFATLDALKAAPEGSLQGKIAYISNRMERFRDGHGYGPAVAARSGASTAASKGALALVIRSIGTDSNRTPHTGMQRYADQGNKIPAAARAYLATYGITVPS